MNTDSETIKTSCKDILQKYSKNRRHQIKKKYFDTVAANKVSIKSLVPDLTDGEWQAGGDVVYPKTRGLSLLCLMLYVLHMIC